MSTFGTFSLAPIPAGHRADRRMRWWMAALLMTSLACMLALALYLQSFEEEEVQRQRAADTQWLQQTARFHFQRLEDDVRSVAVRRNLLPSKRFEQGGVLWSAPAVVLQHGWVAASAAQLPKSLVQLAALHPDSQTDLRGMLDIARGLRRISYVGPLRAEQGHYTDQIWMAIPLFEQGRYIGSYVAALSMQQALKVMVPDWFRNGHDLELMDLVPEKGDASVPSSETDSYDVTLDLADTDIVVRMRTHASAAPMVPRLFFAAAMLFWGGMLVSLYALSRDIRKRRQIELQLRSQVALRTAMENSVSIGLRAWDAQGRILYVNRAFCTMVGYEPEDLVGKSPPLPYWPAARLDELHLVHAGLMRQGTQSMGVEVQFQHRDGHLIDTLIHEAPLTDAQGQQTGWMSSVLDISERKRAERLALQQQDKLEALGRLVVVGEVASTLAHELNQPLGALSGFANGLLNRLDGGRIGLDEMKPVVDRMAKLADKAGSIIQRVNAFARRREMAREPLELRSYLVQVLKPMQRERQLRWHWELGRSEAWVDADPGLLEHAVRNVASNAVEWALHAAQSTDRVPAVRVALVRSLLQPVAEVGILVGDSGPGVSDVQREHIFSAFHSAKEGGMGMGLAISRSVIEAHHGRIEVGTDQVLGGACFTLWLPLATPSTT